jgi:pyrroline-5-carboxylate reductase
MSYQKVAFVGGGNMTRAIVGGLVTDEFDPANILISEPADEQRQILASDFPGIVVSENNDDVVRQADSVVLAVKPQILPGVCRQLAQTVQAVRPLIISIAAGPRSEDIDDWLGGGNAVVRVMPNQPSLLGLGVSGIVANDATTTEQLNSAREILSAVGPVVTVPNEQDIDAVTAISGSGPAYFYLLIDMLAKTGADLGLDERSAQQLAIETAQGAAALARASGDSMDDLITRVSSPGGTTAAALDSLLDNGIRDIFHTALTAARDKATELADQAHESGQE